MYRIGLSELIEVARVLASKNLARSGEPGRRHLHEVDRFEEAFARKLGARYALCMSGGGSAALTCALVGIGAGPGDEVLVPAYTWIATAAAVLRVGAVPVLVEVDETLTLDADDVARKIGPATRAVVPVHMRGRAANLERLKAIADERGLKLIEDACQADGGSYRGKRLGTWGDAGAFSFNHWKIITSGEGGALVTNDRTIYERALVYHDNAMAFRPAALRELSLEPFLGEQYRASEIMGALLRAQLARLDGILRDLRRARTAAEERLGSLRAVKIAPDHDAAGNCGLVLTLQFESEATARAFADHALVKSEHVYLPIDTERHVYTNWAPILEDRIGHHPAMNPLRFPANEGLRTTLTKEACPRTLEILRRTVLVELSPDWSARALRRNMDRWWTAAMDLEGQA